MTDKIVKREGPTAIDTLRALMVLDGDDTLSIAKTALRDGNKGLIVRGLSILQRWNEDRFCGALLSELEDMRRAGKIRENFNHTDAGVASVREFFELIDGKPDERHFHAFCALFMSANAPDANPDEAVLDIELMGILKKLTAGEMHLLSALLKLRSYFVGGESLPEKVAKELGHGSVSLVQKNVIQLIEQQLVRRDNWQNFGGSPGARKDLLTDLGMALHERVQRYNDYKKANGAL